MRRGACLDFAPDTLGDDANVCIGCLYHRLDHIDSYIRSIRNDAKRRFAEAYTAWLYGEVPGPPDRGDLSYMAAQAVEMRLGGLHSRD